MESADHFADRERPDSDACAVNASVVIPVFGAEDLLTNCLRAIWTTTDTSQGNLEIVLVDNGTGYEMFADTVIRNPENLGYAVACNQGAKAATADILVMLNVDTEVQPGWLPPLLAAFDDPEVAMAGPRIIHPDGSLQTASGIRTWHGGGGAGGEEMKIDGPSCDADGVTGACMVVRKNVYDILGGMCELYWAGNEDVDLCLTVREAGHRIRYVAESCITHIEGASGAARWVRVHENVALLNQRWGSR